MEDRFGHRISYLRVSITDRCNERCTYCMPQELQEWLPRHDILTFEETLRLIRIASELGVTKIRLTGGEPLTRRDVVHLFRNAGKLTLQGVVTDLFRHLLREVSFRNRTDYVRDLDGRMYQVGDERVQ